jgi:hypothetical protein
MSAEVLFSLIEKELDEALSFICEFKDVFDVFNKSFSDQKRDYKTVVLGYKKLLDEIGNIDKVEYTIIFCNEYNYNTGLPYKHKIEKNVKP